MKKPLLNFLSIFAFCFIVGFVVVRAMPDDPRAPRGDIVAHVKSQRQALEEFDSWMKTEATPEDWHRFALGANWDFAPVSTFRWIVDQPECDKATALAIFHLAQPDFYLQFDSRDDDMLSPDIYDLVHTISERWQAGGYTRGEIALDIDKDIFPIDFAAIDAEYGEKARKLIPESMRQDLPGKRITLDGTSAGMPDRFWK